MKERNQIEISAFERQQDSWDQFKEIAEDEYGEGKLDDFLLDYVSDDAMDAMRIAQAVLEGLDDYGPDLTLALSRVTVNIKDFRALVEQVKQERAEILGQ
jgi:hypothetical protein